MRELIEFVAKGLVSKPDEVKVEEVPTDRQVVIELTVDPADVGKVIGKQGRTARAMRSILKVKATKLGQRATLEIL